jgi:hypothetical protein
VGAADGDRVEQNNNVAFVFDSVSLFDDHIGD